MFYENLPKWKGGKVNGHGRRGTINGKESIGYVVKFIYDEIEGEIKIVDYYMKNNISYFNIEYLNKKSFKISISHFKECKLGELLGKINHEYKYNIGNIINQGKIKILKQTSIDSKRAYEYKCLICGNIDIILEYRLLNSKHGCNVCTNQKVLIGYNDMWTTNRQLAKLLANSEDGYKYTQNSHKKVEWKCPNCGNIIKDKKISDINNKGLPCSRCGDGFSYPEKFMFNVLEQLRLNFKYHKKFKWSQNKEYDFYFKINNKEYIIETHGLQHYEETGFELMGGRTLKEEQENDKLKEQLALKYGRIEEDNYIVIDCSKSELEWIKNNILHSILNNKFNLSDIDWKSIDKKSLQSILIEVCNLWKNNTSDINMISKKLRIHNSTIRKYLEKGEKQGMCSYNPIVEKRKSSKINIKYANSATCKKIICLTTNRLFKSISQASNIYNVSRKVIGKCCNKDRELAGIHPITGEPLKWIYLKDYIMPYKKQINIHIIKHKIYKIPKR